MKTLKNENLQELTEKVLDLIAKTSVENAKAIAAVIPIIINLIFMTVMMLHRSDGGIFHIKVMNMHTACERRLLDLDIYVPTNNPSSVQIHYDSQMYMAFRYFLNRKYHLGIY